LTIESFAKKGNLMGSLPLSGIKIISFAQLAQGPAAVQLLADFGADVIKVESPKGGAWERQWSGANLFPGGESLFFLMFNRNQRSITLNLKDPQSLDVALRLIDEADVVVENYRSGVMERLGLGYDDLSKRNPRLIYCASTGYGTRHPLRDRPGQDLLMQAVSGLAWLNSLPGGSPRETQAAVVDFHASLLIVVGILLALQHRQSTGRGQKVETSLLASAFHLQSDFINYAMNGWNYGKDAPEDQPYGLFATKDGQLALGHASTEVLAKIFDDPRFSAFEPGDQFAKGKEIKRLVAEHMKRQTTRQWLEALEPMGIWCAPVSTYDQVANDKTILLEEDRWSFDYPAAGKIWSLAPPVTCPKPIPPSVAFHPNWASIRASCSTHADCPTKTSRR
jgi:crotonobetainyl-CoA:carnitine CoA-transferase CaiB-like acyl-CoA transferase